MRKKLIRSSVLAGTCLVVGSAIAARAQVVVDGTINPSEGYGGPLATQTINTSFGDSTYTGSPNGPDANGSELDANYGVVQGSTLYLFLAGDFQNNGNHVNLFIADGRAGQSTLNASVSPINAMNGSVFSSNFGNGATYVVDTNDYQGTAYTDVDDLTGATLTGYDGAVALSSGIGSGTLTNGIALGLNNSNISQMGASGTAANQTYVDSVTTGLEYGIPLSLLGNPLPGTHIDVLEDINGGGDSYLSNQFLPGLPLNTQSLGGGGTYSEAPANGGAFNFSNLPGEYYAVTVPEPVSIAFLGGAALMLCSRRRRA